MDDVTAKLTTPYKLKRPVKGEGPNIDEAPLLTEVTLAEPDLNDLAIAERAASFNGGGNVENSIQLISLSTGLSVNVVRRFKAADLKGMGDIIEGFISASG